MKKEMEHAEELTLGQRCYDALQEDIIAGVLQPGEKLKVEPLKERFQVGQSPIREALSRLVASGLVAVQGNKGFRVATVSEEDIRDTYATFTLIETTALALAIKKGDDAWAAEITAQFYQLSCIEGVPGKGSYANWVERNYHFHRALIAGCQSPALLELREHIYMKFDRYCRMSYQWLRHDLSDNHKEHKKLAKAVLNREAQEAKRLMVDHINEPLEAVIKQFKKHGFL